MEKKNFILLLSLLSAISFAQLSENGLPLNNLRKLESSSPEIILLGYDQYNFTYDSSTKQSNCNFTVHFLLKNWNYTKDDINDETIIKFNNITLKGIINYQGDDEGKEAEFNCSNNTGINGKGRRFYLEQEDSRIGPYYHYYHARFLCDYNLTGRGIPKKINITTNFTNDINLNGTPVSFVSSSAEALEKDLVSLKYYTKDFIILENANFTSQSPNYFKIKADILNDYGNYYGDYYDSENIYLITTVNGSPKKILCSGKMAKDNSDDEDYYFLQSKGSNNLAGANLSYALLNYTTRGKEDTMAIISFAENSKNVNGTILPPKVEYKKNSGGLSTGGICAIVIPAVLVLLGVGALVFFLSRRAVPSPPIKTIGNNTMGVVASSEAVVHQ
jgi:hypothetical protein